MDNTESNRQKISEWYNQKVKEGGEDTWRPPEAYTEYLDYLKFDSSKDQGKALLDVGCGTGFFLKAAAEAGLKPFGVDLSEEAVNFTNQTVPNVTSSVCPGEELCFDDKTFDYLTCLGVLEHFLDIGKGVEEMVRVTRDDATLCIMVPNDDFLLWKLTGKPGTAQQDINEQLYSLAEWRSVFEKHGLSVAATHKDKWFARRSPFHWLAFNLAPVKYTYQIIFVLRKTR